MGWRSAGRIVNAAHQLLLLRPARADLHASVPNCVTVSALDLHGIGRQTQARGETRAVGGASIPLGEALPKMPSHRI